MINWSKIIIMVKTAIVLDFISNRPCLSAIYVYSIKSEKCNSFSRGKNESNFKSIANVGIHTTEVLPNHGIIERIFMCTKVYRALKGEISLSIFPPTLSFLH